MDDWKSLCIARKISCNREKLLWMTQRINDKDWRKEIGIQSTSLHNVSQLIAQMLDILKFGLFLSFLQFRYAL